MPFYIKGARRPGGLPAGDMLLCDRLPDLAVGRSMLLELLRDPVVTLAVAGELLEPRRKHFDLIQQLTATLVALSQVLPPTRADRE